MYMHRWHPLLSADQVNNGTISMINAIFGDLRSMPLHQQFLLFMISAFLHHEREKTSRMEKHCQPFVL